MPPRDHRRSVRMLVLLLAVLAPAQPAFAQARAATAPPAPTADDYARAEKFLAPAVSALVVGGSVSPTWLPDDRFTYRSTTAEGVQFLLVDPVKATKAPAFDHVKLAAALGAAAGGTFDPKKLPFQTVDLSADGTSVAFDVGARRWSCDVAGAACKDAGSARGGRGGEEGGRGAGRGVGAGNAVTSPDGKRAVFIKDWNLWVRDVATGQEKALTADGVEHFGYATDNAGWRRSSRPVVLWSPDSRKVATFQQDERKVGDMYLVETKVGHPVLQQWKYPLPGDEHVAMLHRVIIDADSGATVRLKMDPDYHRAMLGDDFSVSDMIWNPDASKLAFVSTSRDHKSAVVRMADAATGDVRTVFEEKVDTHFESLTGWRVLWETGEIIWNSQRDDWSHLYLYDLASGQLKNRITSGAYRVSPIIRLDEKSRSLHFVAMGSEKGQDPYFRHAYRIGLDGKGLVSLTPEDGDHSVQLSPSGKYLIDTYSTSEKPPVVVLRDSAGKVIMPLEQADISKLLAAGWKPPIPFSVKARDGKTDLYGMMFRPTNFDPAKKYPIINYAYPGPQSGSVGSRSFSAARRDNQALAELGFVVVAIDGMGTPGRSKSFHDAYYGAMGRDNTLPDQVAGMKELAGRHPWIDIDRAAMWGHSGGGFIAADAMFRYPDFFKVGISESGNHDQRVYEDDWGERYQGLLVKDGKGSDNYEAEANQSVAKNLKGKLLLAHGLMDDYVPPYNTLLVVDALVKANKDFDLILFPHQAHGFGADGPYMMRRRWDYFVK
ncbi:MAG TPA: DPP IV N-terminal domain-containing protein, partial [Vicinamibacterales bacterium]|nr:DPP IV N-terminal domain-containing protein [Vicinamibacterales bacterium]